MAAFVAWPASPPAAAPCGTRIISFCLFGDKTIYGEGAVQNAHLAKALFPGWACVFYVGDGASDVTVEALQAAGAVVRPARASLAAGGSRCSGSCRHVSRALPR